LLAGDIGLPSIENLYLVVYWIGVYSMLADGDVFKSCWYKFRCGEYLTSVILFQHKVYV